MLSQTLSRHVTAHELFGQEVMVGIDDIVIYQKKYELSYKSWFYGIKIPKWVYRQDPSELMMIRGMTPEILLKEIIDINYLSTKTFNDSYGKYRKLTKLLSLIAIVIFLILMAIPSAAARIFFAVMISSIIICNIINAQFIKPTETAMNDALKAVIKHVQINLNVRYNKNNIRFEISERSTIIHHTGFFKCLCNDTQHTYYHITVCCIDNVISPRYSSQDSEQLQLEICDKKPMEILEQDNDETEKNSIGNAKKCRPDTPFPSNENARKALIKSQNNKAGNALSELPELHENKAQDGLAEVPLVPSNSCQQGNNASKTRPDTPYPIQGQSSVVNDTNEFMMELPEVRESEEMIDNNTAPFVIHEISDDETDVDENSELHHLRDDADKSLNTKKVRPDTPFPAATENQQSDVISSYNGLPRIRESYEENANAENQDLEQENEQNKQNLRKDYHYNWAQTVGRKRESWLDPHAQAKKADPEQNK